MNLDFSKCKNVKDVEKIFKKNKKQFQTLKKIKEIFDNELVPTLSDIPADPHK